DYTFQIFLLGIFFQMAVRFSYLKVGIESLYVFFYFVSILVALYIPTIMAIQIKKSKVPLIRLFFGL
ncbi:MAG: acyltransferase, partial [Porphyromonadaceae bacterium]|nr:acyltransferase [Porphyromonadaceae bacterium]